MVGIFLTILFFKGCDELNSQDMVNNSAGEAGKKVAGKGARKLAGKAGKLAKKLAKDFIKKVALAIGKSLLAFSGSYLGMALIIIFIIAVIIAAIPFADWFLGGNARSEKDKERDIKFETRFKEEADKSVAPILGIEADANWKEQLMNTVKPSWGIPTALVRYQLMVSEDKVTLSDFSPVLLVALFSPDFEFTKIKDDIETVKTITYCTSTDSEGNTTTTGPDESINSFKRPAHDVLSRVTLRYGDMTVPPLKRYYPGGSVTPTGEWEETGTSSSGDCTSTHYRQYEHTTVDDRYVPHLNINVPMFHSILGTQGVNKDDMKLFYEFIQTADPEWNPYLYGGAGSIGGGLSIPGEAKVSAAVMRYEPLVRKYAVVEGIEDQVNLILALIQQESGGNLLDVMQSSESLGLPRNTITDPEISIKYGVKHFANVFKAAGGDVKLTLQSYNFGSGFISYAKERGGYSKETAIAFSKMWAARMGWSSYGDVNYVDNVMRYYSDWTTLTVTSDGQIFDVQEALNMMSQYMGMPYVWGGRKPSHGGFDCSGIIEYTFNKLGINLYGNAETQFKKTAPVSASKALPGDLVFWSTYKPAASHVGMYLGNDKFINSNGSKGLSISSVTRWNSKYPFLGYRRIVK